MISFFLHFFYTINLYYCLYLLIIHSFNNEIPFAIFGQVKSKKLSEEGFSFEIILRAFEPSKSTKAMRDNSLSSSIPKSDQAT